MGSFGKQTRISLHFLALSFIQSLELHEATVLRLVWMFKLLFLTSPSERAPLHLCPLIADMSSDVM